MSALSLLGCLVLLVSNEEPIQAVLELVDSPLMVGRSARVKLRIENRSQQVQEVDGGALFGDGIRLTRGDTLWFPAAAPPEAKQAVALPPGAALETVVDLARLEPEAFAEHGNLEVAWCAEKFGKPLFVEVWRDLSAYQIELQTDFGNMRFELYPDKAPRTVKNFIDLVDSHFYDGLLFHRVVTGFMIQGGCPRRDGTGNSGTFIPFEQNDLRHERGTLAMARQASMDSASCQFFVVHERKRFLDGSYCAFGRLVEGFETLDKIAGVECRWAIGGPDQVPSRPVEAVYIRKARLLEVERKKPSGSGTDGEDRN